MPQGAIAMRKTFKNLSVLLPIILLSACDSSDVSEKSAPTDTKEKATVQTTNQQQATAPVESESRAEPETKAESESSAEPASELEQETMAAAPAVSGEALYTSDKAPDSMLYDKPQKVIDGVWSAIGATAPARYENSGHNNNLSFVITTDGVLVVNAGGSYLLAEALHTEIKKITDQPVKYVVLENGQGHAMLGSGYWKEQGATVIAHKDAAHEIEEKSLDILEQQKEVLKDKADGTKVVMPDETFEDKKIIEMGGERIELLNLGPAHSPGDIIVWLPQKQLVISGDMAFHQRMLPLFEETDTAAWIESWDNFAALDAKYVIPGHGEPTDMAEVTRYTKDYLVFLREKVGAVLEDGGSLLEAYEIDQSDFMHLPTAEFLSKRNAGQVFQSMEFE
jgi:glyoxylase-like metal-dependent hydrolase (beta-lactamase superfamily II)